MKYTCSTMSTLYCTTGSVCAYASINSAISNQCPPALTAAQLSPDKPGDTRVLGMGRLAYVDRNNMSNTSDQGFLTMIGAARTSVKISQQDIGPPAVPILGIPAGSWPDALFAQLGAAMVDRLEIFGALQAGEYVLKRGREELATGAHVQTRPAAATSGK